MRQIDGILDTLRKITKSKTDKEMCNILEVPYGTFDIWKTRDSIPAKRLLEFAKRFNISVEELTNAKNEATQDVIIDNNIQSNLNAREQLNQIKDLWGLKSDKELAEKLGINKLTLDNWVRRDKISNEWLIKIGQMTDNQTPSNFYSLRKVKQKASAGGGAYLDSIEVFDTGEIMIIDKNFFKVPPTKKTKIMQVDGYSMIPVLLPDSWVIFEENKEFKGDGLYVLNYSNQLMVKMLQLLPDGVLSIISSNKDYKSYEIKYGENNEHFAIVGKVIKSII
ncbi:LexA family transcriptional regulator [Campylobacter hyointestinalis]|uniref:Transcriptional regulator n=1 Tax=Campylobacter hyointestinalis subsp. hyointestinalis TaxID=91352 RepID=A0A9W5AQA1_CAMHY|nr:LexA family transcriptional regulator [Campylobacter hyointestinalis]CUU74056.1 transcriptional regulator [Campylobacter hyointestinalis subsp. hyointestinalis]CUU81874.1 transcriptional regulator [Campylobacter hyointestinalis subsp. hyointestinalis]